MNGGDVKDPILQVLGSKRMESKSVDKEHFRVLLCDGINVISHVIRTTPIADEVVNAELSTDTIIKVTRYSMSMRTKYNKRVMLVEELEMLMPGEETGRIGNPQPLPEDDLSRPTSSDAAIGEDPPATPCTSGCLGAISKESRRSASSDAAIDRAAAPNTSRCISKDIIIRPISSISPYHNKWTIKARVTHKSQIRKWSNFRGEGQLFSVDFVDESGEIRATIFKKLVDKFYAKLEMDKVYYIRGYQLKAANKQFNNLNNDYEMFFTDYTVVRECLEVDSDIPRTRHDFVDIDKIAHIESGTLIDVIGICKTASDVQTFQAKSTGRELKKRELALVDHSNNEISLTLWGTDAEQFDGSSRPIVSVKNAKVGEFGGGKTISVLIQSIMRVNPDLPESHRLRSWYDNGGSQQNTTNISAKSMASAVDIPWLSFQDAQDRGLGNAEQGDYFKAKVTTLSFRPENCVYKACPTEQCNKKVVESDKGAYRCEKCDREYLNFKYRLIGSVKVSDWSDSQWVSMFASEAEKVLGTTSQDVGESMETNPDVLDEITNASNFKQFIMKFRAKTEIYNDEERLKMVAIKADPINYKEYNAHLISRIHELINKK